MNALLIPGGFSLFQEEMTKNILKTLKTAVEDIVVIDCYKSLKLCKLCEECGVEICKIDPSVLSKDNDYKTIYKEFFNFFKKQNIDNLIVYRMPFAKAFRVDNISLVYDLYENIKKDGFRSSFAQTDRMNIQVLLARAVCLTSKNIFQYIIDPHEARIDSFVKLGDRKYKCYSYMNFGGMKFMPLFEYSLLTEEHNEMEKTYDFYFECSCVTKDRLVYKEAAEQFCNDDKFYCKVNKSGLQMKRQKDYYDMIRKSKFTMIIKPYASESFSLMRLYESVVNGCVPLVEEDCSYKLLSPTLQDIYDIIIENDLLCKFSKEDICRKVNELDDKREEILQEFKNCKSFKKLKDEKRLRNFYDRLFS